MREDLVTSVALYPQGSGGRQEEKPREMGVSLLPGGGGEKPGLRVRPDCGGHVKDTWAQRLWKLAWELLAKLCTQWISLAKCQENAV